MVLPDEPVYVFSLISCIYESGICKCGAPVCIYIVGKESKNVYVIPNQGSMSTYQIQDSQQPTTLKGRSLRSNPWVLTFEGSIA